MPSDRKIAPFATGHKAKIVRFSLKKPEILLIVSLKSFFSCLVLVSIIIKTSFRGKLEVKILTLAPWSQGFPQPKSMATTPGLISVVILAWILMLPSGDLAIVSYPSLISRAYASTVCSQIRGSSCLMYSMGRFAVPRMHIYTRLSGGAKRDR